MPSHHRTALTFYTATVIEVLAQAKQIDDALLLVIMPFIVGGLRSKK